MRAMSYSFMPQAFMIFDAPLLDHIMNIMYHFLISVPKEIIIGTSVTAGLLLAGIFPSDHAVIFH